jgi:hypothetical protein
VRARFACIEEANIKAESQRLFNLATKSFQDNNTFMVGHALAIAAAKMCRQETLAFL